jgi:cell division protein FtsQ
MLRVIDRLARLPRGTGLVFSVAFLSWSAAYGMILSGRTAEVFNDVTFELGFSVDEILITGQREVSEDDIVAALAIPSTSSLFTFDAEAARERLAANPWIADVSVLKLYPNKVEVVVEERAAFGLWQETSESPLVVIDRNGDPITTVVGARFADLPRVVGIGADKRIHEIVGLLAEYPSVQGKVRAAMLISERRWDLVLDEDIVVMLPENDAETALAEISRLDEEMNLLTRDIERVDMRLADRMAIELTDAAKAARDELMEEITAERRRRSRA